MFKVIDLFSGIGGFSLGLEATGAFQTIAFCEQDKFCQAVLKKHWPGIPIHPDVKTFDFEGGCDIITGGVPCQPFSVAGKQKGFEDDRHLWPHMFKIVAQKRPSYVIFENVAGHITMGLDQVLFDLESEGYTTRPFVIPACAVNAPHKRDRVWIIARNNVANPKSERHRGGSGQRCGETSGQLQPQKQRRSALGREAQGCGELRGEPEDVADTTSQRARQDDKRLWTWVGRASGGQGTGGEDVGNAQHDGFSSSKKSRRLLDKSKEQKGQKEVGKSQGASGSSKDVADTSGTRLQRREQRQAFRKGEGTSRSVAEHGQDAKSVSGATQQCLGLPPDGLSRWVAGDWERGVPRVVEKEEGRKMKLQALGNAVVPQIVEQIGLAIIEAEKQ